MEREILVNWTGSYPCLCMGGWIITIDGVQLMGIGREPFNTYGIYKSWHFNNWMEEWDDYKDGMLYEDWIENVPNGLLESLSKHGIELSDGEMRELYSKIQEEDWRYGSCGGCI